MIRGLYTSAMGMIVQERRQANVSQNLSNVETNSFRQQQILVAASHRMNVLNRASHPGRHLTGIGSMETGTSVDGAYTDDRQGVLQETKNPLDFAIDGDGFFAVRLPDGQTAYTRDGSFQLDADGQLVTGQGYPVLGTDGQGILPGTEDITVDAQGGITMPDGRSASLAVVSFANPQDLNRLGDNLYTSGEQAIPGEAYELKQGFLEGSNVDSLTELVRMIEISRNFESNQKVAQAMDETLGKAVNEVGKL